MSQIHLSENSIIKTNEDSNVKKGELIFDKQSQDLAIATREGVNEQLYYCTEIAELYKNQSFKNDIESCKEEIISIDSGRECTCLTKNNVPILFGKNDFYNTSNIKSWSNIKSIASNPAAIVAIDEKNNILWSSSYYADSQLTNMFNEKNIIKITGTGSYFYGLKDDGSVTTQITNSKFSEIQKWKDMKDIIGNDTAIIGIKNNGTLEIEGSLYDHGYLGNILLLKDTEVVNWNNVEKLASNHTGLISLNNNRVNHIYLALHVPNREEVMNIIKSWTDVVDIAICENGSSVLGNGKGEANVNIIAVKKDGTCYSINSDTLQPIPYVESWTNVEKLWNTYYNIIAKRTKPVKTTYEMFKEQIKDRIIAYNVKEADFDKKIFGIRVDMNNADPDAACVYTDDAFKMTPMWVDGDEYENLHQGSWNDSIIQKLIGCRPCILEWTPTDDDAAQDTHVLGYLDPNDYTKWVDGRPTGILDKHNCMGILGHSSTNNEYYSKLYNKSVMIEFDKVYFYTRVDEVNKVVYIKYSKTKHNADWKCHPAFIWYDKDGNSIEKDHLYVSAYTATRTNVNDHSNIPSDMNGFRCSSFPGDIRSDNIFDLSSHRSSIKSHIMNNGYKSKIDIDSKLRNPATIWRLLDFETYNFLLDLIRILFKSYNLYTTNLFKQMRNKIPTELNNNLSIHDNKTSSRLRHTVNTGLDTYNKGLFWKGYAKSGVSWYDGYFNPPEYIKKGNAITGDSGTNEKIYTGTQYMFPSLKLFGIDQLFFNLFTLIDGIYVDMNSVDRSINPVAYKNLIYKENALLDISTIVKLNKNSNVTSLTEGSYYNYIDANNISAPNCDTRPSYLSKIHNGLLMFEVDPSKSFNGDSYMYGLGNSIYVRRYDTSIYPDDMYPEAMQLSTDDGISRIEFRNDNYTEPDRDPVAYMICRL